ncbi:MAG: YgjV family protein, partial [Clostridia bacterium]|nr:YgjV family protein [Clostridia bacterium]
MWTPEYILSQISVIVATIIFALSYFTKNKKIILVLGLISILFYILEYLLLHSYIAVGVNFLSFLRTIWFYINDAKGIKQDYVSL